MYIYLCIYVYVYICICIYVYIYVYVCMCIYVYMYIYVCVLCVCMCIYIYTHIYIYIYIGFPNGLVVKNLPAMQKTWVQSLSWEDLLKEEMATHSSVLACEIAWAEEAGRLQSMGSEKSRM